VTAGGTGLEDLIGSRGLLVATLREAWRRRGQTALVAGLGIAAILVHSLFYNAFFEDPMTWALFGLVALTAWKPSSAPELESSPMPAKEAVPV